MSIAKTRDTMSLDTQVADGQATSQGLRHTVLFTKLEDRTLGTRGYRVSGIVLIAWGS